MFYNNPMSPPLNPIAITLKFIIVSVLPILL
jgi:hypothetical protein